MGAGRDQLFRERVGAHTPRCFQNFNVLFWHNQEIGTKKNKKRKKISREKSEL